MPTDPFVQTSSDDAPRQAQNFAPGVHMPPARGWRADRPGEVDSRAVPGRLAGTPGPNVGFALTLAGRARDRFRLESGEQAEDAIAVVAELAMKRAATLGRAPTNLDVDFAIELLGYASAAMGDVAKWRPELVRGADHDYVARRGIADSFGVSVLRLSVQELPEHLLRVRAAIANGEVAGTVGPALGSDPEGVGADADQLPPPSGAPLAAAMFDDPV